MPNRPNIEISWQKLSEYLSAGRLPLGDERIPAEAPLSTVRAAGNRAFFISLSRWSRGRCVYPLAHAVPV